MVSLLQLQQFSVSLPCSVTSVVIIKEGGANPVTDHTLFEQWVRHIFPFHIEVNGIKKGVDEGHNPFEPLDTLQSLCGNPLIKHNVSYCLLLLLLLLFVCCYTYRMILIINKQQLVY